MWKRVVAPTLLVSLLWIAVSAVTTHHIQRIYDSHTRILTRDVTTIEAAWGMRRDVWKLQASVLQPTRAGTAGEDIRQLERVFEASLTQAEATSFTPREQSLVKTIRAQFEAYREHLRRMFAPPASGAAPQPSPADVAQSSRLASAVAESARELLAVNQEFVRDEARQNASLHSTLNAFRLASLIAGPIVGLAFGLLVARGLNRSLARIRITLQGATGTLGTELGSVAVSAAADDLPALQRQVSAVADRIRKVVDELEDARRRAIQSERLAAVGELAAGVAHEIRNPLTSVKLLIQTASQRQPNPGLGERQFEVVLGEILRMEGTIQGLLDFARPPRLRRVAHDVRQTLRRALNLVHGRAQHQGIAIEEDVPPAPVCVDGDPEQLHQVFVNLAINGIEAMARGGTLRVAVHADAAACRIVFRDAGPGIPAQLLPRLFEPFVTDKERGTGLGLAISRRIVQEHGGSLVAANPPGGGAEMTVELQCATVGADAADAAAAAPDSPVPPRPDFAADREPPTNPLPQSVR